MSSEHGSGALGWLSSPGHREWLKAEERRILGFPRRVLSPHGDAVVFSADGTPIGGQRSRTFDTARIAHVHALAAMRGEPGARLTAEVLLDYLHRFRSDGWPDHPMHPDAPESLYTLAFVILAAATGVQMGHEPSSGTLDDALRRLDEVFSEGDAALAYDRVSRTGEVSPYRGLNGNMHLVEALFAAGDVSGDDRLVHRANAVCDFVIDVAQTFDGRICEHFDSRWRPRPQHNRDRPDHEFVPFGATVGHGIEWARLIAQSAGRGPSRYLSSAVGIFDRAVEDGWAADGEPGFLYTTDWSGAPVTHDRFHWVAVEAIAAASVFWSLSGESRFEVLYEQWLDYASAHFIDRERGSWHHRLDRHQRPVGDDTKPDLYHAYQAMLIPQLPVTTSIASVAAVRTAMPESRVLG